MPKAHRRKDVIAAVIIIGTAILYWTSGEGPGIVLDDHQPDRTGDSVDRPDRVTELPGFGRPSD
ncbi:MAG: hypothetical protein COB69_08045 [Phycisphaera sp.]|nr:MAG: hypothetical protein COB69_08045 [Phycisphaera sp.]